MYQLTANNDVVIRLEDGCVIPRGHRLWDEYEVWLSEANSPQPVPMPTPEQIAEAQATEIRAQRDALLRSSDWTQVNDAPLDVATKAVWATYRQALRDVPEQAGFPDAVTWPTVPGLPDGAASESPSVGLG